MNKEEQSSSQKGSENLKNHDFNERNKLLNQIKSKVHGVGKDIGFDGALFEVWALIGGMGDFIGREFYIEYEGDRPVKIIQKPIRVKTLLSIFEEFTNYSERQKKEHKDNIPKNRGRV